MKATKSNGVEFILTTTNECDERPVEQMVGKAMCAYANYVERKRNLDEIAEQFGRAQAIITMECAMSEYEATVRCISMFAEQSTSYICQYVISRATEELGI